MIGDVTQLTCTLCAHAYQPGETEGVCERCGGILDVEYDYEALRARGYGPAALRADRGDTVLRYAPLLPLGDLAAAPPLAICRSPFLPAPRLAQWIGVAELLVKDERTLPSGSLKDRGSWIGVARAVELGYTDIVCASTGNAASSLAAMAASAGITAHILVPHDAPLAKLRQVTVCGADVMVIDGTYDEAYALCDEVAREFGWYNRNCARNPYLVEGKKTAGLELAEQIGEDGLDWLAVSVGDGCTVAGIWKGLHELHEFGVLARVPRMLAVQAAGADPIVEAFLNGGALPSDHASDTIAGAIAVGRPRNAVKALRAVERSGGAFLGVGDDEIMAAAAQLPVSSGFFAELGACAALAGVVHARQHGTIAATDRVGIVLTGHGLKDDQAPATEHVSEPLPCTIEAIRAHVSQHATAASANRTDTR